MYHMCYLVPCSILYDIGVGQLGRFTKVHSINQKTNASASRIYGWCKFDDKYNSSFQDCQTNNSIYPEMGQDETKTNWWFIVGTHNEVIRVIKNYITCNDSIAPNDLRNTSVMGGISQGIS